jgi:CheY-like chemotaxis protein
MEAFGQLAGGVAHDFNNILAVVMGNTELVEFMLEDGNINEVAEINEQISQAAHRGANLTRQLLTFARREAGHPRVVDVSQVLRGFEKLVRRVLEETVELHFELQDNIPPVMIDPGRLEQVMMNLCVNARDAMPTGGRISVRTRVVVLENAAQLKGGSVEVGEYVVIETEDSGGGIAPDVLERVFEPFFTTKPAGQGTGLGLATAHGIIRDAGGALDVRSSPGKGTLFQVYLAAKEHTAPADGEAVSTPLPRGVGASILLCEDEKSVRTLMTSLLERGGFKVKAVSSGATALDELARGSFDILVTDAVMPEMDGGQLAKEAQRRYPDLPVLFVSGYTGGTLETVGVEEDSVHFLRKPFRARELLERITAILA